MEIPLHLKNLYKHWKSHADYDLEFNKEKTFDSSVIDEIEIFASERMRIWEKKEKGAHKPYTSDTILQTYRFCNIYRELDKQTIQIHSALKQFEENFNLWLLNLVFERFVCKPETVQKVGFLNFDSKNNKEVYNNLLTLPSPKYGSAYVFPISVIQKSDFPTRESFFCFYLPKVISEVSKAIAYFKKLSVIDALSIILPIFKFNFKFHWTEILIDIAYQHPEYLDLFKAFLVGPGSVPTMRIIARNNSPEDTCIALTHHEFKNFPYLSFEGKNIKLSAENWEGIGCEFRKYTNLKNGVGRKRKYLV